MSSISSTTDLEFYLRLGEFEGIKAKFSGELDFHNGSCHFDTKQAAASYLLYATRLFSAVPEGKKLDEEQLHQCKDEIKAAKTRVQELCRSWQIKPGRRISVALTRADHELARIKSALDSLAITHKPQDPATRR